MSSQRLSPLTGLALTLGALLWITIHVMVVITGLVTGKLVITLAPAQQPLLAHIYYLLHLVQMGTSCSGTKVQL